MSTTETEKTKLQIPVYIPEVILKKNPQIDNYQEGNIVYEIEPSIPAEFVDNLKQLVPSFNGNDLVTFNPLIAAVNELQQIKILACDADDLDASERVYIDNNKLIGTFNSGLAAAKKALKDPHLEYNRKVDAIFKLFENEAVNTRNALQTNFDVLLKKREEEKKKKEEAKKAAELQKIQELANNNSDLEQKLQSQKKTNLANEINLSLANIITNITVKIPTLNLEGLGLFKTNLLSATIDNYILPEYHSYFTAEELAVFKTTFQQNIATAVKMIDMAVIAEQNKNSAQAPIAQSTEAPAPAPENMNVTFENVSSINNLDFAQGNQLADSRTNTEKFSAIAKANLDILKAYEAMIEMAKNTEFTNTEIAELRNKLVNEQFTNVLGYLQKISNYCNAKEQIINQHSTHFN